MKKTIPARRL